MNERCRVCAVLMLVLLATAGTASAVEFHLRAAAVDVEMPDGRSVPMWGYAWLPPMGDGVVRVPGPVLTVPPGDSTVTIHLQNDLPVATSLLIPGQNAVLQPVYFTDSRGRQRARSLTAETDAGSMGMYTWTNVRPGAFLYHSGTHMQVQVQMGLYGAMVKDQAAGQAYAGVPYDQEVVLVYSEIDPGLHDAVAGGQYGTPPFTSTVEYEAEYYLVNGKPYVPGTPNLQTGDPGTRVLIRALNAGLESRALTLLNANMNVVAEHGFAYTHPRSTYSFLLTAGQTKDAVVVFPAAGVYPFFDRRLGLSNGEASGLGGMITRFAAGDLPVITSEPASQTVCLGEPATFSVAAEAAGPLSYQWRKDGDNIDGETGDTYEIAATTLADAGQYDVVVSTASGQVFSAVATLTVNTAPTIDLQPIGQTVMEGSPVTLVVVATGADLAYQWFKDDQPIDGETADTLTLDPIAAADAGSYKVEVSNPCGTVVSDTAVLKVASLLASEDWESANYNGGVGWLGVWLHTGDVSVVDTAGPHGGTWHVRLRQGSGYLERAVDLDGVTEARLQFWAKVRDLEGSDHADIMISPDGVNYTTVRSLTASDGDNVYRFYDVSLESFTTTAFFRVAFDANMSATNDHFYLDDIQIIGVPVGQ